MKRIVWYCNLMYYSVFQWYKAFVRIINYLNPITYIVRIPKLKDVFKKSGMDNPMSFVENINNDPRKGITRIHATFFLILIIILFLNALINYVQIFVSFSLNTWFLSNSTNTAIYFFSMLIPPLVFTYFIFLKGKKYLKYFEEFDKMDKAKIRRYHVINFIVLICIIGVSIYSFKFYR